LGAYDTVSITANIGLCDWRANIDGVSLTMDSTTHFSISSKLIGKAFQWNYLENYIWPALEIT
jgi:hypothetical protein